MARAKTPLIITGNIYTSRAGQTTPLQLGADTDQKIAGLRDLTDAVHKHGSKIFAQISHCGRQVIPSFVGQGEVVSASNVKDLSTGTKPRALRPDEIEGIVTEFGESALRCKTAGFDGVQIHGGHGYLVSQFLTPYTNRRSDDYGGSPEKRLKFLQDVYRSIREKVGDDYPVILKINGNDYLPLRRGLKTRELVEIARHMEAEGIDAVEVSVGHYESGFPVTRGTFQRCLRNMLGGSIRFLPFLWRLFFNLFWPVVALVCNLWFKTWQGYNLRYAKHFTKALSIPVICVGGFLTRDKMQQALQDGHCDAISAGRAFIADPLLYEHLLHDTTGPQCVYCNACVGHIGTLELDCYHPDVRKQKDEMLAAGLQARSSVGVDDL